MSWRKSGPTRCYGTQSVTPKHPWSEAISALWPQKQKVPLTCNVTVLRIAHRNKGYGTFWRPTDEAEKRATRDSNRTERRREHDSN